MQRKPACQSSRTAATLMAAAAVMPLIVTKASAQGGSNSYLQRNRKEDPAAQSVDPYVTPSHYQQPDYQSLSPLAQQEMIRRQDKVRQADEALAEGRKAYAGGDYEKAVQEYRRALDLLPDAPMLESRRAEFTAHLTDGAVALSQHYRRRGGKSPELGGKGTYEDARELLEEVLRIDPENILAKRELGYIDDPIRTNAALTYEHTKDIDEVRRALYMGEGHFNLGKYDDAKKEFEKIINIDPYNSAARRWLERVASARSDYYRAAYDHTRAELLSQVDAAWELAVPRDSPDIPGRGGARPLDSDGASYILQKLRTVIIPVVDFEDTSVEEAIDFLRQRSMELDTLELDPSRKGVNFVIRKPQVDGGAAPEAGAEPAEGTGLALGLGSEPGAARIKELRLRNVPLATVLKYICEATRLRYKVDDFAVTIVPATETSEDLVNRTFVVPPGFLDSIGEGGQGGGGGGEVDPFAPDAGGGGPGLLKPRPSVEELLKNKGVPFPEGSSASFNPTTSSLIVRNTPTNIDLVEQLVEAAFTDTPKQIKILTKFVEVSQENNDELGFDWIVTPFGIHPAANELFLGGGTIGSGTTRTNADFISPVDFTTIPGIPAATGQNVSNIVTGANRSGDAAISRNSIDAILNNPDRTAQTANVAPGILSLTGLFSDGQIQMIMRGLAQKKGADIMTAPSVTARSGQKATIEIIREFIYPTEYEPPELPNQVGATGGLGGGLVGGGSSGLFPVTPATPTAFETRNTGVTLEIEPTLGANDYVIDLRFAPEIVEFEGFINYGSPIQSPSSDALGNPTTVTITENRIEMPVFSSRKVNTALTIYDGYTVAVGGLLAETVQNVEDKVPILGDIPIIGRLFQTKAENRIKSNLIIFVTASIIDATGRPISRTGAEGGAPLIPEPGGLPPENPILPPLPVSN